MTVRKEAESYELNVSREAGLLWISLLSFLIWALPTCLLEGRAHVLLEMDPLERAFCTLIAKSLIGTMGTVRLFRYLMTSQFIRLEQ